MAANPRRSISRAASSVARRRPGTATRLTAGSDWGIGSSSLLPLPVLTGRGNASPSAHPLQLLQGAEMVRHGGAGEARLPVGVGDLAHVDVATGIERQPVRRHEL